MVNTANKTEDETMALELAGLIDSHKGEDTIVLDVRQDCGFADFFIIATATSSRHRQSLAGYVLEYLHGKRMIILGNTHKPSEGGWTLVDGGSLIVHLMEHQERGFYELEKLWFQSRIIYQSSKSS